MKKSVVAAVAALAGLTVLTGCSKKADTAKSSNNDGKVLNIYVWNDEFQTRFNAYCLDLIPEGVTVNWVVNPNQGGVYQDKLDEALLKQKKAPADEKVDIFLVEADYALKYVDTDYTLDVVNTLGISKSELADQYKYTQDVMTDSKGALKGVTWQACPGGFAYRRSIAKDVLGTDDPVEVGKALSDWDKFDAVAAKAKAKGYFMLSGFDDAFRVFSDNVTSPWVVDGKINVDPQIKKWVKQTKTYTEKKYNNLANLWSPESTKGMGKDGKVFGYFGPAWFIDFCMAPATPEDPDAPLVLGNGSYGDWAFCKGPQGFSWGGTWICGATGTDNADLVKKVMQRMTCDPETMTRIALEYNDFTNNEKAMIKVANSDYQNAFLGGQNHIKFFLDNAKSIDKSNISPYDQGMAEKLQAAMADYYNGKVTEDQAWDLFYTSVLELYPNLSK